MQYAYTKNGGIIHYKYYSMNYYWIRGKLIKPLRYINDTNIFVKSDSGMFYPLLQFVNQINPFVQFANLKNKNLQNYINLHVRIIYAHLQTNVSRNHQHSNERKHICDQSGPLNPKVVQKYGVQINWIRKQSLRHVQEQNQAERVIYQFAQFLQWVIIFRYFMNMKNMLFFGQDN